MRLGLTIGLAAGLALATAPAAVASPTDAHLSGSKLLVVGDASAETYTVASSGSGIDATVTVSGPTGFGAHLIQGCTSTNTSITCDATKASSVWLDAADGADDITVNDGNRNVDVRGNGGNDTLRGGTDGLRVSQTGGPGDDTFIGADGVRDSFTAEDGNDTYHGGTAPVPPDFDPARDPAAFQVDEADDEFTLGGATGATISLDDAANDSDGKGGTDNVGADVEDLSGSTGNDVLTAGANPVEFYGDAGDDVLTGSPGDDFLAGSVGNDTVRGNAGDDTVDDGDLSFGLYDSPAAPAPGNDTLDGGPGNDRLDESFGTDDVAGGAGIDTVHVARAEPVHIETSNPYAINVPPLVLDPVTISLDDRANDGQTGTDEHDNIRTDVENVSAAFDIVNIDSVPAPATITGSAGPNRITTGDANDIVDGGAGADVIDVARGDDTVQAVDQTTDTVNCGAGTDRAAADLLGGNPTRADALHACETVTGTALPATVVFVPSDPARPKPILSGKKTVKVKAFLKRFTLPVGVTCDQACSVAGAAVSLKARLSAIGDLTIGSGKLVSATGRRTLKVRIAKHYRKALKRKLRTRKQRRAGVRLAVTVTVTNAGGQSSQATRRFTVKG